MPHANLFEMATGIPASQGVRECRIDTAALSALFVASTDHKAPIVVFNLFDDVALSLTTAHVSPLDAHHVNWRGYVPGQPEVHAHLSVSDPDGQAILAGHVHGPQDSFKITSLGAGRVKIIKAVPHTLSTDDVAHPPRSGAADHSGILPQTQAGSTHRHASPASEQQQPQVSDEHPAIIDLLVVYPSAVLKDFPSGTLRGLEAEMQLAVSQTNFVFQNSRIPAEMRIVGFEGLSLKHHTAKALLYEVAGCSFCDPPLPADPESRASVNALREQYQADIVVLVVQHMVTDDDGKATGGIASLIPQPPGPGTSDLEGATCAIALQATAFHPFLLAHECGHLLGAQHDRITQPEIYGNEMYDYVRGYAHTDPGGIHFVTVMGYPLNIGRAAPFFSSADPDIHWHVNGQDLPVGSPLGGIYPAADASRFLRLSVRAVADYRGAALDGQPRYPIELGVEPTSAGTILPQHLGPYAKGSIVTMEAIAMHETYTFSHWLLNGTHHSDERITTIEVKDAKKLTAVFDDLTYCSISTAVEPSAELGHITQAPSGERLPFGTHMTLSLTPTTTGLDYAFDGWEIDGEPAAEAMQIAQTIPRTKSRRFIARFVKPDFAVEFASTPPGLGSVKVANNEFMTWQLQGGTPLMARQNSYYVLFPEMTPDVWFAYWEYGGNLKVLYDMSLESSFLKEIEKNPNDASLVYSATGPGWIQANFQGGKNACHVIVKCDPPEAGTVSVALQKRKFLEIPEHFQRFYPGTPLLAKLTLHPATAEKYRFLGWRFGTSGPLMQANSPDLGYQWSITSDCEVTAVLATK
jgi:hypothetical protein